ncbi:kinase-like domain-containing protein, partial [Rhizophagus irregularis DAOM 181602=DAOM 197198]
MSNNTESNIPVKFTENSNNEWINWIEEAIAKDYFKYYELNQFTNFQEIGVGGFGKVYRAKWKSSPYYLALKSFFNCNNVTIKEIVKELKIQREVDFHENIIRFCGIATENQVDNSKKYLLVMEYANGGTLREYLKKHFDNLTWNNKSNMAFQLACAILCLHDEGIIHRDLHSKNVLVHQNIVKLADFGLSKRIEESSNLSSTKLFGMVPYIDPKSFSNQDYKLNKKSDIYSIGILLWEISSGNPPFDTEGKPNDVCLAINISQGLRETPIPDTPEDYVNIYADCWNNEPDNRPTINQVVFKLNAIILKNNNMIIDDIRTNDSCTNQLSSKQQLDLNAFEDPINTSS